MSKKSQARIVKRGVILFGHGSPVKAANDLLKEVAGTIRERSDYACVLPAFLEFDEMDLMRAAGLAASEGCDEVVVAPYFLYSGSHIRKDLPALVRRARGLHPSISFIIARSLEFDLKLVEVALERIEEAIGMSADSPPGSPLAPIDVGARGESAQHPIEKESFEIIEGEMGETEFNAAELSVVKRMIHATADFDFKDIVRFSPGAMAAGMDAVSRSADIITDVTMVRVGINTARLRSGGMEEGRVLSFASDREVARLAREEGTTRTAAAMKKAARYLDGSVVVIGNAPTALRELLRLVSAGEATPALVIGTPVGFVGAEESKEELMSSGVEYISCVGRKGGSAVAVAAINAVIIEAVKAAALKA